MTTQQLPDEHMLRRCLPRFARQVEVDVCVLGGGAAGIAAAMRAVDFGKTVAVVEKAHIGGADYWDGALQSKTMWEISKFCAQMRGSSSRRLLDGATPPLPDPRKVRHMLQQAALVRSEQVQSQLKAVNIDLLHGEASFVDPTTVSVKPTQRTEKRTGRASGHDKKTLSQRFNWMPEMPEEAIVKAKYYVIATGSVPRQHPDFKSNGNTIVTTATIMRLNPPKSLVIVGAGVIGCEFATIMANLGLTEQVNVIERRDRILPIEDADIGSFIQKLLEEKNVTFHLNSKLNTLTTDVEARQVCYSLENSKTGEKTDHCVERALVSIGRVPEFSALKLDKIGVDMRNGRVAHDQFLRTEAHRHIYVVGDASMDRALVNAGEHQARGAVEHMFSNKPVTPIHHDTYKNLTSILFLDQEVAAVGWNEQDCRARNVAYKVAKFSYEYVPRALCMNNVKGFVKVVVTNDRRKRLLGVRAVGPHASSVVEIASIAIRENQSVYDLESLRTAYPAITQGFQECVRLTIGRSTLKANMCPGVELREWEPPHFNDGRAYRRQNEEAAASA